MCYLSPTTIRQFDGILSPESKLRCLATYFNKWPGRIAGSFVGDSKGAGLVS